MCLSSHVKGARFGHLLALWRQSLRVDHGNCVLKSSSRTFSLIFILSTKIPLFSLFGFTILHLIFFDRDYILLLISRLNLSLFQVISILIGFTVCLLHSHRCILFRRVFFIAGLMYFYRAVTMSGATMDRERRTKMRL